jgi:hemoglobin-like flavoprotein
MSDLLSPPPIPRPDLVSAAIVRQSLAGLAGREDELTTGLYRHLFELLPEIRGLAAADVVAERTRLWHAFLASAQLVSVQSLSDPAGLEERLEALGESHHQRGLQEEHLQYLAHAMVRTLRDVIGGGWSTRLSSAWISVLSWAIAHMVRGARRAQDREEAQPGSAEPGRPGPDGHGSATGAAGGSGGGLGSAGRR